MTGYHARVNTTTLLTPPAPIEKIATTTDELSRIYQQRYDVTVNERGLNLPGADHDGRFIRDELDERSVHIYAERNGSIAGTLRLTMVDQVPDDSPFRDWYRFASFEDNVPAPTLGFTSELVVGHAWRGTNVVAGIVSTALAYLSKQGGAYAFCHCNPSTVALYERLGYRRYTKNFRLPGSGYHVPLVLPMNDATRLNMLGSPLQYVLPAGSNEELPEWLVQMISERVSNQGSVQYGDDLWQMLARQEHRPAIPLFAGLEDYEIERLSDLCPNVQFTVGDRIVGRGDAGDEMYVLIDGDAEVRAPDGATTLAMYEQGDVFGEMSLLSGKPRSADVIARSDGHAVVITNAALDEARAIMGDATYKLMRNLAEILSSRLFNTNLRVPRT